MIGILLFAIFFGLLIIGVPVGFSIALASLGIVAISGYPIAVLTQRMYTGLDSFPLMAIPLFMLAGTLMGHGGITSRIINLALAFLGNIRGSLALVVGASGIALGTITGSGVANVAALGTIMLPEMKKREYDPAFSAALVASSGVVALIIPPSIAIIIYGVTAQVSIGSLFMATLVPGLLMGFLVLLYGYIYARIKGYPKEANVSWPERWQRFKDSILALLMPVILIGGIFGGVFTPTEAGAVVSMYAFIIGMFVYKEIKIKHIPKICMEAAFSTSIVAMIIAATSLFGWLMTLEQIPQAVSGVMLNLTDNDVLLMLIILVLMIVIGLFMDSGPKIMIFTPIFAPVAVSLGVDLLHFGAIVVVNAAMGLLTPPVGTGLFVASSVSGVPLGRLNKALIPFYIIMTFVLLLVTFVPALSMWAI
ncbi:MAG: TRAP transporter large permease [Defluviitaleaceae bacterium]|nr:TRAP transporter large permease [Defluviitaleaceae bacterium]